MVPQSQVRKTRNSSKVNLIISLSFHGFLVLLVVYFAARSGILGHDIQTLTVRTEKEKVEPKKEPEKKPEPPKDDDVKVTTLPVQTAPRMTSPTTTAMAPPPAAPPPVDVPAFDVSSGATVMDADPVTIYKGLIESKLRTRWKPPEELSEKNKDLVADVEVSVDASGRISNARLTKRSGNAQWDNAVSQAVAQTAEVGAKPPKGFPNQVVVRFDVAEEQDSAVQ